MKLTDLQKNILTLVGVGALGFGVYYIAKRKNNPRRITNKGQTTDVWNYLPALNFVWRVWFAWGIFRMDVLCCVWSCWSKP